MNRREAVAALMSLPMASRLTVVPGASDDVIVLTCERDISINDVENLKAALQNVWPTRKVVVIGGGFKLSLVPK